MDNRKSVRAVFLVGLSGLLSAGLLCACGGGSSSTTQATSSARVAEPNVAAELAAQEAARQVRIAPAPTVDNGDPSIPTGPDASGAGVQPSRHAAERARSAQAGLQ